jgi:ABC-type glycerol-3-phosphate transport system substrate-binding protein
MGNDKTEEAREMILDLLETGSFKGGDKLPGAREIAAKAGISLLTAQAAVKTLERDGLIELRARSGCYLREEWRDVPVDSRVFHFSRNLPWMPRFEKLLASEFPDLKISSSFGRCVFEFRTTTELLSRAHDYMDLARLFKEACPDPSLFFEAPFRSFRQNGRLVGVPFIFSPRVLIYNTEIFKRRGCEEPRPGWTWDDFIGTVRALRAAGQPREEIYTFSTHPTEWMNFVFASGGALFDPSGKDPVRIDSPQTRRGLSLFKELQRELGVARDWSFIEQHGARLMEGRMAMTILPRELRSWFKAASFENWGAVPLPSIDGRGANTQATDLLCVRRECRDFDKAVALIRFALSKKVQDFIADERYGIPIRKSSAARSLEKGSSRDQVFFDEAARTSAEYHLDSPELSNMIADGIGAIWRQDADIDATTAELASAIRTYLKVKKYGESRR